MLSPIQNGRGLPQPLNIQQPEENISRFNFSPKKKETIVELNPVQKRKQCIGERTARVGSLIDKLLLIALVMT